MVDLTVIGQGLLGGALPNDPLPDTLNFPYSGVGMCAHLCPRALTIISQRLPSLPPYCDVTKTATRKGEGRLKDRPTEREGERRRRNVFDFSLSAKGET